MIKSGETEGGSCADPMVEKSDIGVHELLSWLQVAPLFGGNFGSFLRTYVSEMFKVSDLHSTVASQHRIDHGILIWQKQCTV
jgi:hypothetical protein